MEQFYCAAPWHGLHINPRGDIKTCCAGNPNMLGNLNDKTISQVLNGAELTQIRDSLLAGRAHAYCVGCVSREQQGAPSERSWHNSLNREFDSVATGNQYAHPTLIDIRWNNTCNLSCNYCNPLDSSKWATLKGIPVRSKTSKYYEDVCDFLEKNHQHIKEVALVGGEPFLLPQNERLLDVIPVDAVVTIITNLNTPLESNKIFQKLAQRRRVGWSMSFDNIADQFEYVRHGASWALQQHNLDLVQNLMRHNGHWGGIHAVYNLYNATGLVRFKQYATARGLSIKWQSIGAGPLKPQSHGHAVAKLAAAEIEQMYATCEIDPEEKVLFDHALAHYRATTAENSHMLTQLGEFVKQIEQYHPGQLGQFARLWPELADLCV